MHFQTRALIGRPRPAIRSLTALAILAIAAGCANEPAGPQARIASGPATTAGADPAVNQQFYKPDLKVWTERFEGESREIYHLREKIVAASGARAGMTVADVGAGTGFFAMMFARRVAPGGRVIAVEISQPFADAIERRAKNELLANVAAIVGSHTDTRLPADSADIVFASDTYHHLEQVGPILSSIRRALKPGGILIIVDFERIPGVTPKRTLDHVRAGKETVIQEVTGAGFRLREEKRELGLRENYYLVFDKG
jgi:SAM-dependent methyltransferase